MKKDKFVCILIYSNINFENIIDNRPLESIYESKQETQENKTSHLYKTDFINTKSNINKTSNDSKKYAIKQQKEKSHKHSPIRIDIVNNEAKQKENINKKAVWFFSFGKEAKPPNTKSNKDMIINLALQFGIFKCITKSQAFRFSIIANYNYMVEQNFNSLVVSIDYFYDKRFSDGFDTGVFADSVIYTTIYSTIYKTNILLFTALNNVHIEAYAGYQFYQDSNLSNYLGMG